MITDADAIAILAQMTDEELHLVRRILTLDATRDPDDAIRAFSARALAIVDRVLAMRAMPPS